MTLSFSGRPDLQSHPTERLDIIIKSLDLVKRQSIQPNVSPENMSNRMALYINSISYEIIDAYKSANTHQPVQALKLLIPILEVASSDFQNQFWADKWAADHLRKGLVTLSENLSDIDHPNQQLFDEACRVIKVTALDNIFNAAARSPTNARIIVGHSLENLLSKAQSTQDVIQSVDDEETDAKLLKVKAEEYQGSEEDLIILCDSKDGLLTPHFMSKSINTLTNAFENKVASFECPIPGLTTARLQAMAKELGYNN